MSTRAPEIAHNMKPETIEALQDLAQALTDSHQYLQQAADSISDDPLAGETLRNISLERKQICSELNEIIELADEEPAADGTFGGSLRKIWTSFRAGLNAGDATVVLIEAERAEDAIVEKFRDILPEIAGNPISDRLNKYFTTVKHGHDQILKLRNAHQNQ